MDLVRARFALDEFGSLFGEGFEKCCDFFPNSKDQKKVLKIVWKRWLFFRFHYVDSHGKMKEREAEQHTFAHALLAKVRKEENTLSMNEELLLRDCELLRSTTTNSSLRSPLRCAGSGSRRRPSTG